MPAVDARAGSKLEDAEAGTRLAAVTLPRWVASDAASWPAAAVAAAGSGSWGRGSAVDVLC